MKTLVKRVILVSAVLALAMSAVAALVGQPETAVSIAAGAVAAIVSFLVLVFAVARSLAGEGGGGRSSAAILAISFVKLGLIGAALWWLVSRRMIEPITFLVGFSSVVIALLVEGVRLKREV